MGKTDFDRYDSLLKLLFTDLWGTSLHLFAICKFWMILLKYFWRISIKKFIAAPNCGNACQQHFTNTVGLWRIHDVGSNQQNLGAWSTLLQHLFDFHLGPRDWNFNTNHWNVQVLEDLRYFGFIFKRCGLWFRQNFGVWRLQNSPLLRTQKGE